MMKAEGHDPCLIDESVRTDMKHSVLCWLATVAPDGTPNVTPKEIFAALNDNRIVVADIASSNTVRNIRHGPRVCVSFVDVFRQKGFKIAGKATVLEAGHAEFALVGAELLRMAGSAFLIRNVISIEVERISRIWAPSYRLMPEQTEEMRMQGAYDAYGVFPAYSSG